MNNQNNFTNKEIVLKNPDGPFYPVEKMAAVLTEIANRNNEFEIAQTAREAGIKLPRFREILKEFRDENSPYLNEFPPRKETPLGKELDAVVPFDVENENAYHHVIDNFLSEGFSISQVNDAVGDKFTDVQNKYVKQNVIDMLKRKFSSIDDMRSRMPLCQHENSDGSITLTNIPEDYAFWSNMAAVIRNDYLNKKKPEE